MFYSGCQGLGVLNGKVEPISGSVTSGRVVTVSCVNPSRYVLFGKEEVTCASGGSWSENPSCRKCGK